MTGGHHRGPALDVTLVNQFYPPDISPTAHLTASLAEHLRERGHRVTVLTGGSGYVDAPRAIRRRTDRGVEVVHLWTPAMGKSSVAKRLSDYVTFLVGSTAHLLTMGRQDVLISLTTPPFVVVGAVAHKLVHRRSRVILWSMDCYPDVIERLGSRTSGPPVASSEAADSGPVHAGPAAAASPALDPSDSERVGVGGRIRQAISLRRGGPASKVLRGVNRWVFAHLDNVVALDGAMRALLVDGYGVDPEHPPVELIPNWEPLGAFADPVGPDRPAAWSGYLEEDLADRFVVLYLGNLGYGHRVDTVVDAAAIMTEADAVTWLFVGGGARWSQLEELVDQAGVDASVQQRPYVPKERTGAVMAGAGCALILLADEALGVMSPSKLHANLAAGLPIVYVGPRGSNVDQAIEQYGCGVSLRTGDHHGLARAVRRLRDDTGWRDQLSHAARKAFETAYSDEAVLPAWSRLVEQGSGEVVEDPAEVGGRAFEPDAQVDVGLPAERFDGTGDVGSSL